MQIIEVKASAPYQVHLGNGLLGNVSNSLIPLMPFEKICIVSDSHVFPLYGSRLETSLCFAGQNVCSFVFPAGENRKNAHTYFDLLNFLAENRLTRNDVLIALGGGVVGDLAGFAAATYLRGIRLVQIPTTLLAAVDCSVGGKTAINLPTGKNLAGAFHQPSLVLCDTDTLSTLSEDFIRDGCAEIIKYGILFDETFLDMLIRCGTGFDREAVIGACIRWKRDIVGVDEFDHSVRKKLNLGHTIGHSVEKLSGYTLSHGKAVAIGMAVMARAGAAEGLCSRETADKILEALTRFGLPTGTQYSAREIFDVTLSDKKSAGSTIQLIIPEKIGDCKIVQFPTADLERLIEAGL